MKWHSLISSFLFLFPYVAFATDSLWCQEGGSLTSLIDGLGLTHFCSFGPEFKSLGIWIPDNIKEDRQYCIIPMHQDRCQDTLKVTGTPQCFDPHTPKRHLKIDLSSTNAFEENNFLAFVPESTFQHRCLKSGITSDTCLDYLDNHGLSLAQIFQIKPQIFHNLILWDSIDPREQSKDKTIASLLSLQSPLSSRPDVFTESCVSIILAHGKGLKTVVDWQEGTQLKEALENSKWELPPLFQSLSHLRTLDLGLEKIQNEFERREAATRRGDYAFDQSITFFVSSLPEKPGKLYEFRSLEKSLNELQKRTDFHFFAVYRSDLLKVQNHTIVPKVIKSGILSIGEDSQETAPFEVPDALATYKQWIKEIIGRDSFAVELQGPAPWDKAWPLIGERYPQLFRPSLIKTAPISDLPRTSFNPLRQLAVEHKEHQGP